MERAQSDDRIVALLADRDERGLVALYDHYGRLVYSLIVRIVGHENVAAQLTQEVFLRRGTRRVRSIPMAITWRRGCWRSPTTRR